MFKKLLILFSISLLLNVTAGCGGGKQAAVKPGAGGDIAVLSLRGDTSILTDDQHAELVRVGRWMDKDIIKQLKRAGYNATLIESQKEFKGSGHLLIIDVAKFTAGNRAARAFVGYGAGASSLDLTYKLLNSQGSIIKQWDDGVGSSKGGTYCAQTLNRNAAQKVHTTIK